MLIPCLVFFRCPLFHKPVTCHELSYAVSYSKPALASIFTEQTTFYVFIILHFPQGVRTGILSLDSRTSNSTISPLKLCQVSAGHFWFKTFRCPLPQTNNCHELYFAVSYSKPALTSIFFTKPTSYVRMKCVLKWMLDQLWKNNETCFLSFKYI